MIKRLCVSIVCLFSLAAGYTQDKSKAFTPYGVLGGYFFGDYAYKAAADSLKRGTTEYSNMPAGQSLFNIRRMYLSYNYYLSPKFTSELVLAYEGQTAATSTRNIFIKYMNVKWSNVLKRTDLLFGQLRIPFILNMETLYGYRSVEKTVADMRGIAPSSDLGIEVKGRITKKENIGYSVIVANGAGVHPENDNYKRVYGNVNSKWLDGKLNIDLNYSYEMASAALHKARQSYKAGVVYKTPQITVGTDVFDDNEMHYANAVVPPQMIDTMAMSERAMGISFFVNKKCTDKLTSFARYDYYNPDTRFDRKNKYLNPYDANSQQFFTAGVDYQPIPTVHIMPNIWYNCYHNKTGANDIPGASNTDLVLRLTVYVVYK